MEEDMFSMWRRIRIFKKGWKIL